MKIIIFGATGTIGTAIVNELSPRHEIIKIGRGKGDFQVDFTHEKSLKNCLEKLAPFDAIISAAGNAHFAPLEEMNEELFQIGLKEKLMGQVNLVLIGRNYINEKGSFTLTSGSLSYDPVRYGTSASMVNGAINSFVRAAAIELPKELRINAVSPTIVLESLPKFGIFFRGHIPVPAQRAALAYSKSVEGHQTGQVFEAL